MCGVIRFVGSVLCRPGGSRRIILFYWGGVGAHTSTHTLYCGRPHPQSSRLSPPPTPPPSRNLAISTLEFTPKTHFFPFRPTGVLRAGVRAAVREHPPARDEQAPERGQVLRAPPLLRRHALDGLRGKFIRRWLNVYVYIVFLHLMRASVHPFPPPTDPSTHNTSFHNR